MRHHTPSGQQWLKYTFTVKVLIAQNRNVEARDQIIGGWRKLHYEELQKIIFFTKYY
jgi:hypothetical protein